MFVFLVLIIVHAHVGAALACRADYRSFPRKQESSA